VPAGGETDGGAGAAGLTILGPGNNDASPRPNARRIPAFSFSFSFEPATFPAVAVVMVFLSVLDLRLTSALSFRKQTAAAPPFALFRGWERLGIAPCPGMTARRDSPRPAAALTRGVAIIEHLVRT